MDSSPNVTSASPIACVPGSGDENARRQALLARLRERMMEAAAARGGGVTITFGPQPGLLAELGEFLELERRCCPFLTITQTIQADGGPIFVHVIGPKEAEEMIREELLSDRNIDVPASNVIRRGASPPPARPDTRSSGRGWFVAGGAGVASAVVVGLCCVLPALGAGGAALSAALPGGAFLDGVAAGLLGVSVVSLVVGYFVRRHRRKSAADCGC